MKNFKYFSAFLVFLSLFVISCDTSEDIDSNMALEKEASLKSGKSALKNTNENCATIQDGTILDAEGNVITTGFDANGYNYQARIHRGPYDYPGYEGWYVEETWNDAFLSNKDCDGDNQLDVALGQENHRGTGAWLKNKFTGSHEDSNGNICEVMQVIKYVAVPVNATSVPGGPNGHNVFIDEDGNEIGLDLKFDGIYKDFALIQLIWQDPCRELSGIYFNFPPPGLGNR